MTTDPLAFAQTSAVGQQQGLGGAEQLQRAIASPLEQVLALVASELAADNPKAYRDAVKQTAERLNDLADTQADALYKAQGWSLNPDRDSRWAWYVQLKTSLMWFEQKAKFPRDWQQDYRDLEKLAREHVADGSISPLAAKALLAMARGESAVA